MAFKILRIGSLLYFLRKLGCSLKKKKKKKKKVFTSISSLIFLFFPKIKVFSKKKGFHFDFISNFLPKLRCSLKKKKRSKGLHSELFFTL